MSYKTDIEIARENQPRVINEIASELGIAPEYLENYGQYKGKISREVLETSKNPDGKLILVTAMNPTPAGEGKTTVTIGLGDGLRKIGKKAVIALREPSLGPVFGMKGGAAGGGYAQVTPMDDINLHFTGDFHAIGAAGNLLAAMLDNHIYHGNDLVIDGRRIIWKRSMDMNDRQLRFMTNGLGGVVNGVPREDGFEITVASEIMAVLCLSNDIADLKSRISKIVVAYSYENKPITAGDLGAQGAMAALLKDAIKPNIVQTLEHTPAFIHGGPFANLAYGCNSVIATKTALKLGDYVVTEAGFGADLGAEKFFDIKCRASGLRPRAVVIVATIKALKYNGGVLKEDLAAENLEAIRVGMPNLARHINNIKNFGVNVAVAINKFTTDTDAEVALVKWECEKLGVNAFETEVWAKGGEGAVSLAEEIVQLCDKPSEVKFSYDLEDDIETKIVKIVKNIYGGSGVDFSPAVRRQMAQLVENGFGNLPVCMAKTQYSFSDNPRLLGAPSDFIVGIRNLKVSAGAGFIVALTGDIITMPGLPKQPAALKIDVDDNGNINGIF